MPCDSVAVASAPLDMALNQEQAEIALLAAGYNVQRTGQYNVTGTAEGCDFTYWADRNKLYVTTDIRRKGYDRAQSKVQALQATIETQMRDWALAQIVQAIAQTTSVQSAEYVTGGILLEVEM